MLNQLSLRLKKIFFIKIFLYILLLILLFILVRLFFVKRVKQVLVKEEKLNLLVNQIDHKIKSLEGFNKNIDNISQEYKLLQQKSLQSNYINSTYFNRIFKKLENKYNLFEAINIKVRNLYKQHSNLFYNNAEVKMNEYELIIKFYIPKKEDIENISKDIYSLLPKGTIVNYFKIHSIEYLTPQLINNLSKNNIPMFFIEIKAQLKDIVYKDSK